MHSKSHISALGARIDLTNSGDSAETDGRLSDLREIYEPFLASRVLPKKGLCIDIGSGAGWFGLTFAAGFPAWHVICLEADEAEFAHLSRNAQLLGLSNVTLLCAGVHPEAADLPAEFSRRDSDDANGVHFSSQLALLQSDLRKAKFQRLAALGPRVAPVLAGAEVPERENILRTALPAEFLELAAPQLVKIDAPGAEACIARSLSTSSGAVTGDFITGTLHSYVAAALFRPAASEAHREFYLTHGRVHALRRDYEDNFSTTRPGLDVVVAMYNMRDHIFECVDSVLADSNRDVHVIVVDDGSTDGCGEMTRAHYANEPRVRVIHKANGGCASARNHGRYHSRASHIAFIDADDRVDPGMFSALLELANYTGENVVEAEYQTFETSPGGQDIFTASEETEIVPGPGQHRLGPFSYSYFSARDVMKSQPTIWRRVYRRDFLDNKKILFPEHVRAFDDQIFQLLSAQYTGRIPHVFGHSYHYRQHPAQDIKQGDERHFYSLNMFRSIFLRASEEGWDTIDAVVESLLNTMAWSYGSLRPDLKPIYLDAAYNFLRTLAQSFGMIVFRVEALLRLGPTLLLDLLSGKVDSTWYADLPIGAEAVDSHEAEALLHSQAEALMGRLRLEINDVDYGYQRLERWNWQPEFIHMMNAVWRNNP